MSGRILVLGAAGRMGYLAAEAFREAGWSVAGLVRPGAARRAPAGIRPVETNALDHSAVARAADGVDIVVHALNPPFTQWAREALPLAYSAINAAETAGATLIFPGNLFNYGSPLPPVIDESTPMRPTSRKGRLRVVIEDRVQEATERGMRAIIVRAGDYFGGGRGSWLDLAILKDLRHGRLTYPGPTGLLHEWAYLPDLASAMVRLAAIREALPPLASFGFPGHAVTGHEFSATIARASGRGLQIRRMGWWLIHGLRPIVPLCRELSELAYLWHQSHRIDGGKLEAAISAVPRTPLDVALARSLQELGIID